MTSSVSAGPRGFLIAAPRSGGGKTTLSLGLMRAARRRGLTVATVKCGPDYIDPAFHAIASGGQGLNLDSWAMSPALMASLAGMTMSGADLVIAEGLMGLFDGIPGLPGRTGSSADISALTGWPVLLVLDVSGQSQSAGAVALGCASFDPRVKIAGVVLNRVGSPRHKRLATEAIERVGLTVVGALPRDAGITLPERHLGLIQAAETKGIEEILDRLAGVVESHVDIDAVLALAQPCRLTPPSSAPAILPPGQKIAVARDAAFSFLYPHLLRSWRSAGAEISFFSPLADEGPPSICDMCWLPGGYPELHAGRLAAAAKFHQALRLFAATKPVHGECGGFMVMGRALIDASGIPHAMTGLLDHVTSFAKPRMTLGYRQAELMESGVLGRAGARFRGHEFHYSTIGDPGRDEPFAMVRDGYDSEPVASGSRRGLVTGSYFHLIAPEG